MGGPRQPEIQLALDLTSRAEAMAVSMRAAQEVERLEVGTPLLLAAGVSVVSELRELFPEVVIIADTKICDAGERIAVAALRSGADVVTIVPTAADSVTWQGVRRALQQQTVNGRRPRLMADLIGCTDLVAAAQMAAQRGADELCLHLPKRYSPESAAEWELALGSVSEARLRAGIPVYVAGGITPDDVPALMQCGADGFIVGGAITGAQDPAHAARQFRGYAGRA